MDDRLPAWRKVLVVVAHPDDESFGLGAVIDAFVRRGSEVHVLCLTRGEASTLGGDRADLAAVRTAEFEAAAAALGVRHATLLDRPDGALATTEGLAQDVAASLAPGTDGVVVFDPRDGVTGHPDHRAASLAGLRVAVERGLPVLGWALPATVTQVLADELGVNLSGYPVTDLDIALPVRRDRQEVAIRCHASQAVPGSLLWRRLELLGALEYLRRLTPAPPGQG